MSPKSPATRGSNRGFLMRLVRSAALLAALATLTAGSVAVPATAAVAGHATTFHKIIALHDPLAVAGDYFGHQVAMSASGTEVLVGAHLSKSGNGLAYLYTSKGGKWSTKPSHTFTDPVAGPTHYGFGVALSPSGTTAYIGADVATVGGRTAAGAVYVYQYSHGAWSKKPTVIGDPGKGTTDYFGLVMSVSADGGTLAVGAPGVTAKGVPEVGAAYVYTSSHGKLPSTPSATIPSPTPSNRGLFGYNLSISNNGKGNGTLVVGAYATAIGGIDTEGAAYIFDSKGIHSWKLAKGGSLKDPGNKGADFFGGVVATDAAGTVVMVGAQDETEKGIDNAGAVFTYVLKAGTWKSSQTLVGPANGTANFAYPSISANGKVALTGAPSSQVGANSGAGVAFIYVGKGTTYSLGAPVPDPTGGSPNSPEYFGNASALSATGTVSVIAAPATGGTGGNNGPGAVYVYSISPG